MEESCFYYVPPIRRFEDTGYVTHGFSDKSTISARVVKSNDSCGYAISLEVKDGKGDSVCDFTMDRFAALCLTDCIIKNLLNQEELIENEYSDRIQFAINKLRWSGGADSSSGRMGKTKRDN